MSAQDNWLQQYTGVLRETEVRLLARAATTLEGNVVGAVPTPPPWHPLRGICPSPTGYPGVWNWDSAFHAMAVTRWDPQLAREQIQIFLDAQLPTGALPDVLWSDGRRVETFGKPPVMPWAAAIVERSAPDNTFAQAAYHHFVAYEAHWRRDRGGGDRDGLFHYSSLDESDQRQTTIQFESGWDTSVRWDAGIEALWPVDLNCYMVMLYDALASLAARLARPDDAAQWRTRATTLRTAIERRLWREDHGAYVDYDREQRRWSPVLSPASFMPLYVGSATPERAAALARLAADPHTFFPGMPTVAYNDPAYRSDDYWRGPTWLNVAYFALKGLQRYGYTDVAGHMRETILGWCAANGDALYEYYDSRTGAGLGARDFGWTAAFVIELILNWDADSLH
jgi:putative isomerase